jgi:hypothetical protein
MPKKIPLTEWAARHYDPTPSAWTLRRWARGGEIQPAPERVGREWYVHENATRGAAAPSSDAEPQPGRLSLVQRLQAQAA